jgi:hypothetical protein
MRNRSKSSSTTPIWTTQWKNSNQFFKRTQITRKTTREWSSLAKIQGRVLKDLSIYAFKEFRRSEASSKALAKSRHLCFVIMYCSSTSVNIVSLDIHGTNRLRALISTTILTPFKSFSQNLRGSKKSKTNLLF